jgi:putative transposase
VTRRYNFAVGEYYHLYGRGVEKRVIFNDINDKDRFVKLLFFCNSKKSVNIKELPRGLTFGESLNRRGDQLVYIGVYCLMPNHFHILVREKEEGGIPTFMQKMMTAYSKYFNVRNRRTGRLFETSYLSQYVDSDEYLKYLYAYIHLNPVKIIDPNWKEVGLSDVEQTRRYIDQYKYSSFDDYRADRDVGRILNKEQFPEYFPTKERFLEETYEWLEHTPEV